MNAKTEAGGQLDNLLENLKKRPALQNFDAFQRPKQQYDAAKRYPRSVAASTKNRVPTPTMSAGGMVSNSSAPATIPAASISSTKPLPLSSASADAEEKERKSSVNKVADSAWKLLEQIDFNTDLNFDFD